MLANTPHELSPASGTRVEKVVKYVFLKVNFNTKIFVSTRANDLPAHPLVGFEY